MYNFEDIKVPSGTICKYTGDITIRDALIVRSNVSRILNKLGVDEEIVLGLLNGVSALMTYFVTGSQEECTLPPNTTVTLAKIFFELIQDRELEQNLQTIIEKSINYNGLVIDAHQYDVLTVNSTLYQDLHTIYQSILTKIFVPLVRGFFGQSLVLKKPQENQTK